MPPSDIHICRAGQGSAGAEGRAGMVPAAEKAAGQVPATEGAAGQVSAAEGRVGLVSAAGTASKRKQIY